MNIFIMPQVKLVEPMYVYDRADLPNTAVAIGHHSYTSDDDGVDDWLIDEWFHIACDDVISWCNCRSMDAKYLRLTRYPKNSHTVYLEWYVVFSSEEDRVMFMLSTQFNNTVKDENQ